MYEAIDGFLRTNWRATNDTDTNRFFRAIEPIIRHPDFDAENLGAYMHLAIGQPGNDPDVIRYVAKAHAAREYLRATGQL